MSLSDDFFDPLDEMIGAGTIAKARAFIRPFKEQFLALESEAKAKGGESKDKDFMEEVKRLQAALDSLREETNAEREDLKAKLGRLTTEKERFRQEVEAQRIELAKFDKADYEDLPAQPQKPIILREDALEILDVIAVCGQQDMYLLVLNLKMRESLIQNHVNRLLDAGLLYELSGSDGSVIWGASKNGLALLHENGPDRDETTPTDTVDIRLPKIAYRMLNAVEISSFPANEIQISASIGSSPQMAENFMKEMEKTGLVSRINSPTGEIQGWVITIKGSSELASYGLAE